MRLVCVSDVHERFDELVVSEGDVLIIAGDLCERSDASFAKADQWLGSISAGFERVIYVPGNHDQPIVERPEKYRNIAPNLLRALCVDALVEADGLRIYGMPYESEGRTHPELQIPDGVDVLVSHEAPYDVRDRHANDASINIGNLPLRRIVEKLRPRVHIFGHAHFGHGLEYCEGTLFANVAICGKPGKYYGVAHSPTIIDVFPDGITTWGRTLAAPERKPTTTGNDTAGSA